jgi:hypothetical protein
MAPFVSGPGIRIIGVMIAAGIAIAATVVIVKRHFETYPLGVKGDRLDAGVPQADCSQVVWPYGCDWMDTSPDTVKHLRSDRKRPHRHGLRGSLF